MINGLYRIREIFLFGFIITVLHGSISAATVTNTSDSGPGSLRDAVVITPPGGTIDFSLPGCPCSIVLTSGDLLITKDLTIMGLGASQLTISGGNHWRPFMIRPETDRINGDPQLRIVLDGLKLTNGRAGEGPFNECGGGIFSKDANLTLRGMTIANNVAPQTGGGISATRSETTVFNSIITGNTAELGGGVSHVDNDKLTVVDSVISNNRAFGGFIDGVGGGIYSNSFTTLNIINSTIAGNEAGLGSAAYIFQHSKVEMENTTVEGNTSQATFGGGGTLVFQITSANITNCTISGNYSAGGFYGPGITHENSAPIDGQEGPPYSSTMIITNTTIASNTGVGGLSINQEAKYPAITTIRNSIVAKNSTSLTLADVHSRNNAEISSAGYNLIGNGGVLLSSFNQPGDQVGMPGSPIDPKLEVLALNGGSTRTLALRLNSPAVDRGKAFKSVTDQRGAARPNDNPDILNAVLGDGSDIGAYEVQFPVAGTVPIAGRVNFSGGVPRRGFVTLTSSAAGEVRYATVNPFGYYRFNNVPLGRGFLIGLRSKGWYVRPRSIFIAEPLMALDLNADRSP